MTSTREGDLQNRGQLPISNDNRVYQTEPHATSWVWSLSLCFRGHRSSVKSAGTHLKKGFVSGTEVRSCRVGCMNCMTLNAFRLSQPTTELSECLDRCSVWIAESSEYGFEERENGTESERTPFCGKIEWCHLCLWYAWQELVHKHSPYRPERRLERKIRNQAIRMLLRSHVGHLIPLGTRMACMNVCVQITAKPQISYLGEQCHLYPWHQEIPETCLELQADRMELGRAYSSNCAGDGPKANKDVAQTRNNEKSTLSNLVLDEEKLARFTSGKRERCEVMLNFVSHDC